MTFVTTRRLKSSYNYTIVPIRSQQITQIELLVTQGEGRERGGISGEHPRETDRSEISLRGDVPSLADASGG